MASQVYEAQKIAPLANDWVLQIKDDLEFCKIQLDEVEIINMKRTKFKALVNESIAKEGQKYLENLESAHSKSKGLRVQQKLHSYLQNQDLTLQRKQLQFRLRIFTYECRANFRNRHEKNTNTQDLSIDKP